VSVRSAVRRTALDHPIVPPGSSGAAVATRRRLASAGPTRVRGITVYVTAVTVVGLTVFVTLVFTSGMQQILHAPGTFWLLGILAAVGELFPVRLRRQGDIEEITTSTTFAFAIMIALGTGAAAIALAAAVLAADLGRKRLWKVLFNLSGYVLAIAAAGGVYVRLGGSPQLSSSDLWPAFAAGFAFFVVNTAVVEVAVALAQALPPLHHLRENLGFQAVAAGVLLSLSPVVVVISQENPALLPLLALPVASVHWGARASVENTELTELNRLKDDLIAVVSHELRTPLTSIQGYVKTLLQVGDHMDAREWREFLEGAARQGDRLQRLIEELLVAARLDANVESLNMSTFEPDALASTVVSELRDRAARHTIVLDLDGRLPPIRTDAAKVHRILSNLVENALKYTPAGGTIRINGREEPGGMVLSVADDGPGVPPEARDRVFERFYQVDQTTTRRVGGTGLGLYICRRLAQTLGGALVLERSNEMGSVFSLRIPWAPPRSATTPQVERSPDSH
jgi:signal transduction histidine kinase